MRNYMLYFLLAIYVFQSEAGPPDIFGNMKGMRDMRSMMSSFKSMMRPFGCFKIIPPRELFRNNFACMRTTVEDIAKVITSGGVEEIPSLKEQLVKFNECRLERYGFTVEEQLSMKKVREMQDSMKLFSPVEKDVDLIKSIMDDCNEDYELKDLELTAVEGVATLETCYINGAINFCTEKEGKESIGLALPIINAMNSLIISNVTQCGTVVPSETVKENFTACVDKKEGSSQKKISLLSLAGNPREIMSAISNLQKIPEITCLKEIAQTNGLVNDNKIIDYEAVADYMETHFVWTDEDNVREEVTELIRSCGEEVKDESGMKEMKFMCCFIPKFSQTCRLDDLVNSEFLSDVMNRLREKFDLSGIMKLISY